MTTRLGMAFCLGLLLASGATWAAPFPVQPGPQHGPHRLIAERDQGSAPKTEAAKAWLRTKKNQTTRWVDRQKNKLKRLAD